jgi:hypothetical protein
MAWRRHVRYVAASTLGGRQSRDLLFLTSATTGQEDQTVQVPALYGGGCCV